MYQRAKKRCRCAFGAQHKGSCISILIVLYIISCLFKIYIMFSKFEVFYCMFPFVHLSSLFPFGKEAKYTHSYNLFHLGIKPLFISHVDYQNCNIVIVGIKSFFTTSHYNPRCVLYSFQHESTISYNTCVAFCNTSYLTIVIMCNQTNRNHK